MPLETFDRPVIKQILKHMSEDYVNHVTRKAATFTGILSNLVSSASGYSDSNENRKQNKELVKCIDNFQTANDLVNLVLKLCKDAYKIQSNTLCNYSIYSETCHLIAQFIIRLPEIAEKEKEFNPQLVIAPEILELPSKLQEKIAQIKNELNDKKTENCKRVSRSEKVDMTNYYEYIRQLYFLGDQPMNHDPDYLKSLIFPDSHYRWNCPDSKEEFNPNYPFILQPNFAEMQLKRTNPTLEDKIIHEYISIALALESKKATSDATVTPTQKSPNTFFSGLPVHNVTSQADFKSSSAGTPPMITLISEVALPTNHPHTDDKATEISSSMMQPEASVRLATQENSENSAQVDANKKSRPSTRSSARGR